MERRVLPFAPADLALLDERGNERGGLNPALGNAAELFAQGRAFTVWTGTAQRERPVWCGGAVEQHAEHATLWSSFATDFPDALGVFLTLAARRFVAELGHARVDTMVRAGSYKAAVWVQAIGFEQEARLARYFPDGADMLIYTRRIT